MRNQLRQSDRLHFTRSRPQRHSRERRYRSLSWLVALFLSSIASQAFAEESSKLSFHAYLTQAYGWVTDGGPLFGLDENGTSDYRSAAVLFDYRLSDRDKVLVQLATESLGGSALEEFRDEIELDWAFYERRLASETMIRIGRVPIPFGIYNEIRDVGTLLEFYRPPVSIYFEGAFSSETVDGVVISHPFFRESDWELGVDVYAGSWRRVEYLAPTYAEGEAEDALGLQLWLSTPVPGLRFGVAAQRFDMTGGLVDLRASEADRFEIGLASIDADFERFFLRAEAQTIDTEFAIFGDFDVSSYYVLAGFRWTDSFEIALLRERSYSGFEGAFGRFDVDPFYDDLAISLTYRFSSATLARFEIHQAESNIADIATPLGASGVESDYAILSFSATF